MASSSENTGTPLEEEQPQAPPTPNPEPTEAAAPDEAEEEPQTLERPQELFDRGAKAIEDKDFVEAVDCLSQALEIRTSHYGELALECASTYFKYPREAEKIFVPKAFSKIQNLETSDFKDKCYGFFFFCYTYNLQAWAFQRHFNCFSYTIVNGKVEIALLEMSNICRNCRFPISSGRRQIFVERSPRHLKSTNFPIPQLSRSLVINDEEVKDGLIEELKTVNLSKFVSEAVSYICAAKLRSTDIQAAVQLQSLLLVAQGTCFHNQIGLDGFGGCSLSLEEVDVIGVVFRKRSIRAKLLEMLPIVIVCPNGPGAQYPTAGVEDEELASLRVRGSGGPITDGYTKGFGGDRRDTTMVAPETAVGQGSGGAARLGGGRGQLGGAGGGFTTTGVVYGGSVIRGGQGRRAMVGGGRRDEAAGGESRSPGAAVPEPAGRGQQ
ncbi:unnamed protein product [Miscanthus lutarioriparius]|uniref:Uncharacterized protein n=1 Tax=Miscanthus lutarioriparius TaxID=422564 RepID=A0A811NEX5_9POAL|nr:unnamed protein product [Miscanthus lutarioriparius]